LLLGGICHAEPPGAGPNFVGSFEDGNCEKISGWAADSNRLNISINVSLYDGPTLLTTVVANGPRPDIGAAIGDNGLHGFVIVPPPILKDYRTRWRSDLNRPLQTCLTVPGRYDVARQRSPFPIQRSLPLR
jgi:hypothetical protein